VALLIIRRNLGPHYFPRVWCPPFLQLHCFMLPVIFWQLQRLIPYIQSGMNILVNQILNRMGMWIGNEWTLRLMLSMWTLQQICIISYCIITNSSIVPEICDLDVATINALVDYNESVETVDGTWYGLRAFRIEKIRKMTLVRGTQSMISDA
jgi:hypothetical protein